MVGRPEFFFLGIYHGARPQRSLWSGDKKFFFQLDCYQDSDGKREIDQENRSKTRKNSETKIKKDPMMMGTKGAQQRVDGRCGGSIWWR